MLNIKLKFFKDREIIVLVPLILLYVAYLIMFIYPKFSNFEAFLIRHSDIITILFTIALVAANLALVLVTFMNLKEFRRQLLFQERTFLEEKYREYNSRLFDLECANTSPTEIEVKIDIQKALIKEEMAYIKKKLKELKF